MRAHSVANSAHMRFALIVSLTLISLFLAACDESGSSNACSDGPLPLGETPPAPPAECPTKPTPVSSTIEAQISATQATAADVRDTLLDPNAITVVPIDTEGLRNMSQGADVLVSEVMNKSFVEDAECALGRLGDDSNAAILKDIRSYHIDVEELAEDAGVGTLVLTHQVPTIDDEAQIGLVFRAPISAIYGASSWLPLTARA